MLKSDPKAILIICHQRIGDVLFITPIIFSLKLRWPLAEIDVLVTDQTEKILENNPYIRNVLTIARKSTFHEEWFLAKSLWRRYDLSIATTANTKSIKHGFLASKYRVGFYQGGLSGWFKKLTLNKSVSYNDDKSHVVRHNLKLIEALGIKPNTTAKVYWSKEDQETLEFLLPKEPDKFVVLHPFPRFQYKMWHQQGWKDVIKWLIDQKIHVVLTGSSIPKEMLYIESIFKEFSDKITNLSAKISLSMMGCLMSKASAYVGVDTAPTHIAAASGTPTISLFGPSNLVRWGPWPMNCQSTLSPYQLKGSQRQGNVIVLQPDFSCTPCLKEGCERNIDSKSQCLEQFPSEKVIQELSSILKLSERYK